MSGHDQLTVMIGPQTAVGLEINEIVRQHRQAFLAAGHEAMPTRLAQSLLASTVQSVHALKPVADKPCFLCSLNFLGRPIEGLQAREMFPNAENALYHLGNAAPGVHMVLAPDDLPQFFLAARSDQLQKRVRATAWEILYELSWAELVDEIIVAIPECRLTILTREGVASRSPDVLQHLFGEAAKVLPDPFVLLRGMISQTGRAVLEKMQVEDSLTEETALELYQSFAVMPEASDYQEKLGIDRVTLALLQQRFQEDLVAIASHATVEVI